MANEKATICTVRFLTRGMYMSYLNNDQTLKVGDHVICETPRGMELGEVIKTNSPYNPKDGKGLTFILRKADVADLDIQKQNEEDCKEISQRVQKEVNRLKLKMNVLSTEYTLDRTKLMITYLSDERVDFRELLKVLASLYHCRIDLRQIGSRDKAKMVGGIGVCGLPLCCATFLNEFDGISITMAKNQMLALNIPKLSGHCGKLICCLKYEDEAYVETRKLYPRIGLRVKYNDQVYRVSSINIMTHVIKLEGENTIIPITYDQFNEVEILKKYNPKDEISESEEDA